MAESSQSQLQHNVDPLTYGLMGTRMIALRECGNDIQTHTHITHTHTHTLPDRQVLTSKPLSLRLARQDRDQTSAIDLPIRCLNANQHVASDIKSSHCLFELFSYAECESLSSYSEEVKRHSPEIESQAAAATRVESNSSELTM